MRRLACSAVLVGSLLAPGLGPGARAVELGPDGLAALQEALIWTGDFGGAIDGRPSPALTMAVKRFQTREKRPATGRPSPAEIDSLARLAATAKSVAGLTVTIDGRNDVVLPAPRALLPVASRTGEGRRFTTDTPGGARLEIFRLERRSLADLHNAERLKPGRTVLMDMLRNGRSTLFGRQDGDLFHQLAVDTRAGPKGFRLVYPLAEKERFERIAAMLASAFVADPLAPLPPGQPVPSFRGALPDSEPKRAYPYLALDRDKRTGELILGPVTARLELADAPVADGAAQRGASLAPKLEIRIGQRRAVEAADPEWAASAAELRLAELDPSNGVPEVLLSTVTGGKACCTRLTLFVAEGGGRWRQIDGGVYHGRPDFPQDLDDDGRYELVAPDHAFLYALDEEAGAYAPDSIQRLDRLRLVDISARPAFLPHHRTRLTEIWTRGRRGAAVGTNGFLAGMVGGARRVGDGEDAWTFMLAHYDRASELGLTRCTVEETDRGCPEGKSETRTFPEALGALLAENGY